MKHVTGVVVAMSAMIAADSNSQVVSPVPWEVLGGAPWSTGSLQSPHVSSGFTPLESLPIPATWPDESGAGSGGFLFVPTPGAAALLGISALAFGTRRGSRRR